MAALIGVLTEVLHLPDLEPTDTWVRATVARAHSAKERTP